MPGPARIPSIGGYIIGDADYISGNQYKYIPYKASKTLYVSKTVAKKKKKPNMDDAILVQLGGPFEIIGGNDESIGGGNQKMG